MVEKRWSQMYPELLEFISDRLPLLDYISFRGVCHNWRLSPSGRSEITNFSKKSLWLLFYDICNGDGIGDDDDGTNCYLYCHSPHISYTFCLPHLRGATVVHSRHGWLLAHRNGQFFFYNPFTLENVDLPKHAICSDQACIFMGDPTETGCKVFIISRWQDTELEVSSHVIGCDSQWTTLSVKVSRTQLDTMIGAYIECMCKTSHFYSCRHKDRISIYDQNRFVRYNHVRNCIYSEGITTHAVIEIDETEDRRHMRHMLKRFGEKEFRVSTCPFSTDYPSIEGRDDIFAWLETVRASGEVLDEFKVVKAAWIEPTFGDKKMN